MCGLVPTLFLARKASVMLTMNLWSEVGLCNGATRKVIDIIYADNHSPPNLPVTVIVQFDHYTGPAFIDTLPKCVPIPFVAITSKSLETFHERQQLPLKLAWAIMLLIIWLATQAGKMNQILRCDWLPERARWSHLARSGLPALSRNKNFPKSHIINPCVYGPRLRLGP